MSPRIVFIGAGNLATRLSIELTDKGSKVIQVYSRTKASAIELAQKLSAEFTTNTDEIIPEADIYIVALKDSVVDEVLSKINFQNNMVIHCSGSLPMEVLKPYSENIGVLYPLQTFSKNQEIDFKNIPVFIEGNSQEVLEKLLFLANKLSSKVAPLNSSKRLYLHIAAVFASNFVNHFYTIASEVLQSQGLSFDLVHPLIEETTLKVLRMSPRDAQTGPAVRYDHNVIEKHVDALQSLPGFQKLYEEVSGNIHNFYQNISK